MRNDLFHLVILTTAHRCDVPGCGKVLVLDGNMKNSREVCLATHAGYAEFTGLPGRVQTGCPNTPGHKSRYCSLHAPCTALPKDIQFSEDGSPITVGPTTSSEERHVAVILSKRVTRNSNFYQVTTMCIPYSLEIPPPPTFCWLGLATSMGGAYN